MTTCSDRSLHSGGRTRCRYLRYSIRVRPTTPGLLRWGGDLPDSIRSVCTCCRVVLANRDSAGKTSRGRSYITCVIAVLWRCRACCAAPMGAGRGRRCCCCCYCCARVGCYQCYVSPRQWTGLGAATSCYDASKK